MAVTQISSNRAGVATDALVVEAWISRVLNRWPTVGLAVGVVRDGRMDVFRGHGYADVESKTPIRDDTVFRAGSITKTFTGIAVMQLWERGLLDLDAPANEYLRSYKLVPARRRFRPPTVRHLLTHTAGIREVMRPSLSFWLLDEFVKAGKPVPTLAEYYRGGLPVQTEPGTTFRYTDHDFATLGQIVEDLTGDPLAAYMREHIFEPLGMKDTGLVRSKRMTHRLAKGYSVGSRGLRSVPDFNVVCTGAGAAYSTVADMARYAAALASGGANDTGSVLRPATLALMYEAHHRTDPRIPGEGLVFSRSFLGDKLAVWHGGIVPGCVSEMWVAPAERVGAIAFTNGSRRAMLWLPTAMSELLGDLVGAPRAAVRIDVPQRPEIWADLCGYYGFHARLTDVRARAMMGLGAEVLVRQGRLWVRILSPIPAAYRGFELHPDDGADPYVFRVDISELGLGTGRVVFSRDADGKAMRMQSDLHPWSLEKQPPARNPRLWATGALGAAAALATVAAVRSRRRAH